VAGAVVALGGAGVGVTGVVGNLVEGDSGIQGGGDERMPVVVATDGACADTGSPGAAADEAADVEAVQRLAGGVGEERCRRGEAPGGVPVSLQGGHGARGEGHVLEVAALAADSNDPVAAHSGEGVTL
jgi:hypothetical protein